MRQITILFIFFIAVFESLAQDEVRLPADLRQHNLTTYNSSLFNPVLSLDRNDPESVAIWTRWQWQSIDADPTTLYVNYTRKLNKKSAAGAAFFQHNTGIYFNTGGVLNYSRQIQFSESVRLSYGFNLFGFVQQLADTRFQTDPVLPIPTSGNTSDFILQWAPGAAISVERLTLSMASENLLDYNFRAKESNTPAADKIFMGMMSYDFPLTIGGQKALMRPSLYLRTIPQQENQIGVLSLLRTAKYWAQIGYNNFYGVGVGAGATILKRINIGALFEFGTSASINTKDPSFEIIASYFLGKPDDRDVTEVYGDAIDEEVEIEEELNEDEVKEEIKKAEELANEVEETDEIVESEMEIKDEVVEEIDNKKEHRKEEKEAAAEAKRIKKENERLAKLEKDRLENEVKEAKEKREAEAKQALLAEKQKEEQRRLELKKSEAERLANEKAEFEKANAQQRIDSIANAKKADDERRIKELQRIQDSLSQAAKSAVVEIEPEEVKPQAGEKYEEVQTEDGLEPGFYLIANVFGTKKYHDAFMTDLTNKGLTPHSFLRSKNNYNYVYLARFNTMAEARKARDGNYNGRYNEKTWVFRVVGK